MSGQNPTFGDHLYENFDSGNFSYNSHLPVRRAYEAVRCSSESSSDEEHWNNFMLFKFSISNPTSSTPKKGATPARRPNLPIDRSEVDSSASLAYLTCPEISIKQDSAVSLENKHSANEPVLISRDLEPEEANSGVVAQEATNNILDIDFLCLKLKALENINDFYHEDRAKPDSDNNSISSKTSFDEEHWNTFPLLEFSISSEKSSTPKKMPTPAENPNLSADVYQSPKPTGRSEIDLSASLAYLTCPEISTKQDSEVSLENKPSADKSCLIPENLTKKLQIEDSGVDQNTNQSTDAPGNLVERPVSLSWILNPETMPQQLSSSQNFKELNVTTPKPLVSKDRRFTADIVNNLVKNRFNDKFDRLMVKFKKQRLSLIQTQLRIAEYWNSSKISSRDKRQDFRYSFDGVSDNESSTSSESSEDQEVFADDKVENEYSGSEESNSTADYRPNYSLDVELLRLKLQYLKDSSENKDVQNCYDSFISSENDSSEDNLSVSFPYITNTTISNNSMSDSESYISVEFIIEEEPIVKRKATDYRLDVNLLCLKLDYLKESYENRAKNLQDSHDNSISSEKEDQIYSEEFHKNFMSYRITINSLNSSEDCSINLLYFINTTVTNNNISDNVSYISVECIQEEEVMPADEVETEDLESEKHNLREEAQNATNHSLDRDLFYQKLQALNDSYENRVKKDSDVGANTSTNSPDSSEDNLSTSLPCITSPQQLPSRHEELNLDKHSLDKSYVTKEINLAIPKPLDVLGPAWDENNTAVVVKDLVNYRFRNALDKIMKKLKKQRLAAAKSQSRILEQRNMNRRSLGMESQGSYDGTINNAPEILKEEVITDDKVKKENLEEAKSTEKAELATNINFASQKDSYERKVKNLQNGFDSSMSSNDEVHKEVITKVEVHSEKSQKSLVKYVGNAVNGNKKNMKTRKYENVVLGNGVSKNPRLTLVEQNENVILEAEPKPLNQYNERNETSFLRPAIEVESTKALQESLSVGTDDVNYLLSLAYSRILQAANNEATLLSNTAFDSCTPSPDMTTGNVRFSYPTYAEVSGFGFDPNTEEGQTHLRKHISLNEEIVRQVTNLLEFGCNKDHFLGSYVHLDGEKILLLAKTRRDALLNQLYKGTEPAGETSATIVMEELLCQLNEPNNRRFSPEVEQYYMCILEHKTTVYGTGIKMANEYGCIGFGDRFIFENVTNTSDIKISLYSLTVKPSKTKCLGICWMKRRPKMPMMTLIGVACIGLFTAKDETFVFKNSDNVRGLKHQLHTNVRATLNWPKPVKSFLNMGFSESDRQPTWNKRWAVLEEGKLKYFNFPSDELFCSPIGVVDIRECTLIKSSPFKYMMKKTVMLVFINSDKNTVLKLYICADTNREQLMWLERFNASIKLKNVWLQLKK